MPAGFKATLAPRSATARPPWVTTTVITAEASKLPPDSPTSAKKRWPVVWIFISTAWAAVPIPSAAAASTAERTTLRDPARRTSLIYDLLPETDGGRGPVDERECVVTIGRRQPAMSGSGAVGWIVTSPSPAQQSPRFLAGLVQRGHRAVELSLVDDLDDAADLRSRRHAERQDVPAAQERLGRPLGDVELADTIQEPLHGEWREVAGAAETIRPGHPVQKTGLALSGQAADRAVRDALAVVVELAGL